jgi:hypothetical protein
MAIGAGIGGAVINFAIARVAPAAGDAMRQLLTPATRILLDETVAAQLIDAIARAARRLLRGSGRRHSRPVLQPPSVRRAVAQAHIREQVNGQAKVVLARPDELTTLADR